MRLRTSRFFRSLFPLLALSVLCSCAGVSTTGLPEVQPESVGFSAAKLAAVHECFQKPVDEKKVAGGVVLIARKGKVAFLDAVGMQDAEGRIPMAPDTMFRICSMTKPITSTGIMILEEEGRLQLSDPVSKYLPEIENMQVAVRRRRGGRTVYERVPARREITIKDLLTHTSGLTYGFWGREYFFDLYQKAGVSDGLVETEGTMSDNVRRLAKLPLMFQPGSDWEYSLATDVLGAVIEKIASRSLDEFFRERIFEPLAMRDTCFLVPPQKRGRLAVVYQPGAGGAIEKLPDGVVRRSAEVYSASYPLQAETRFFSGGGGLVSTAPDYARFLQMLLNGGELDGVRILQEATVKRMVTSHTGDLKLKITSHGDGFGYGFGVVTEASRDAGLGSVGTFSWGGFYNTYFWVDPKEELIGIGMTQLHPTGGLNLWPELRKRTYAARMAPVPEPTR